MSIADELRKLMSLVEEGILTSAQFEAQKARLLEGPSPGGTGERPAQIGAYRLQVKVGEGGMGEVFRGRHTQSGVVSRQGGDVAIKVMRPHIAAREEFRARFDREADLGLRLDHPNIVKAHDLVIDGPQMALVLEWIDGRPLSQMIGEETGPIPWDRARPLVAQLLDGVEHAHTAGVVHRDLKPENVMVTPTGVVKILDFGIAKRAGDGATKTGTGLGTVDYMAPEQYLDAKSVDQRADVYALGMTIYEMVGGRLPWGPDTSEFEVLDMKRKGDFPPPTAYYPEIPPAVVQALMAAVAVDRGERPSSVGALRRRLWADGTGVEVMKPTTGRPARVDKPVDPEPRPLIDKAEHVGVSGGVAGSIGSPELVAAPDQGARDHDGHPPWSSVPSVRWMIGQWFAVIAILDYAFLWGWSGFSDETSVLLVALTLASVGVVVREFVVERLSLGPVRWLAVWHFLSSLGVLLALSGLAVGFSVLTFANAVGLAGLVAFMAWAGEPTILAFPLLRWFVVQATALWGVALLAMTGGIVWFGTYFAVMAVAALLAVAAGLARPLAARLSIHQTAGWLGAMHCLVSLASVWVLGVFLPGFAVSEIGDGALFGLLVATVGWVRDGGDSPAE